MQPVASVEAIPKDYVYSNESNHVLYQVDVEKFQGPLDLLLLLIRRHQIDIFDIPMTFVCARYLEVMDTLEELNVDIAAEFMWMAAELIHIKSKLLLPKPPSNQEDEQEAVDPRAELVARLLAYQQFQYAAQVLAERDWLDRECFALGQRERAPSSGSQAELLPLATRYQLGQAFARMLQRQQQPIPHQVRIESIDLGQTMRQLLHQCHTQPEVTFLALLAGESSRIGLIITFLAVLELLRLGLIAVEQDEDNLLLQIRSTASSLAAAIEQIAAVQDTFTG